MEFKNLFFREVGTYEDVTRRPYEMDFSHRNQEALFEATDAGRNVSATALSAVARDLLRPTANHEGVVDISGGWGGKRWAWMGVADVRVTNHCIETQYLSGFTSDDGIIMRGDEAIASRNMMLYIDSSFVVRFNYDNNGRQGGWRGVLSRSSQVIGSSSEMDFRNGRVGTVTLTPYDVIGRRIIPDDIRDLARQENFHDTRAAFTSHQTKLVRRSSTMSDNYLHRLLAASAGADGDLDSQEDEISLLSNIQGAVKEDTLQSDSLLSWLATDTRILDDRCVSWGELVSMDPTLDDRFQAFPIDTRRDFMARRGEHRHLDGRDPATMAALTIAQGLPTKMQQLGYLDLNLTLTNDNGDYEIIKSRIEPLSPGMSVRDREAELDAFLRFNILEPISIRNSIRVLAHVRCNIFSDITVDISLDGKPMEPFTFPTFSASSYSNLVTDRESCLDELANSVDDMLDAIRCKKRNSTRIILDSNDAENYGRFGSDAPRHDKPFI